MAFNVVVTRRAANDVAQTFNFIELQSATAAKQWFIAIQKAVESLGEMAQRAPKIPESPSSGFNYRQLIRQSHRIVFRVDEEIKTVFVVRVYHSARAPLNMEDLRE